MLWERELGTPYRWGGDDPIEGFDCSGLVIDPLQAVGILPDPGDWTAADLAEHFGDRRVTNEDDLQPGCLLFWENKAGTRIVHVEIVWHVFRERILCIGARGGGSRTTTREDAAAQNAYVKVRPARPGWCRAVDPFI
jgi:hypothetical protein